MTLDLEKEAEELLFSLEWGETQKNADKIKIFTKRIADESWNECLDKVSQFTGRDTFSHLRKPTGGEK